MDPVFEKGLRAAFKSAKARTKRSGRVSDLTHTDVTAMFKAQGGRCAVSGLAFTLQRFPDAFVKHPFAPSIDRIDSREGYVLTNVRLVCTAVNFGLGQWGEEAFRAIAEATVRKQAGALSASTASLDERIKAAELMLSLMPDDQRQHQRRRIAALKRARTLGPAGLRDAAIRARRARQNNAT